MTFFFRIVLMVLVPLLALLGHGDAIWQRIRGASPAAGEGGRSGHASVYLWFACYMAVMVLALGRLFLGHAPGLLAAVGLLIMAAGVGIRILALRQLGDQYDEFILVRPDRTVVDSGLYGRCRHPLHKGLILEIAGMALISNHLPAFLLLAVAVFFFFQRGVQEERALLAGRGDAYRAYLAKVPSLVDLLPRAWRPYAPPRRRD